MQRVRIGGRTYSDPDVLSLIRSRTPPVDPRTEVLRRARELNDRLRSFQPVNDPRARMEILASFAGVKVSPMLVNGTAQKSRREALVYRNQDGTRHAYYDPMYSESRINFSIGHEIVHTFFPNSGFGGRFRSLQADDSREANELERLCDLGAAELLMPAEEFREAVGHEMGLSLVPRLSQLFGSSYEATVYRLASTYPGIAIAGLLKYRLRKAEQRQLQGAQQSMLPFREAGDLGPEVPAAKYRRQSLYLSDLCGDEHYIPWNKSFDVSSCAYSAAETTGAVVGHEILPNRFAMPGKIEVVLAPYQRPDSSPVQGDVLFLWWRD